MPANRLTVANIKNLRAFYLTELKETQAFVTQVKKVLARLKPSEYPLVRPARPLKKDAALPPKKRGRPPKAKLAETAVEVVFAPESPPLSSASRDKNAKMETVPKVPDVAIAEVKTDVMDEPAERIIPAKKKHRWGKNYRRKGVYLTSWSKPLKRRAELREEPLESAQQQEKPE